ncbi:MAG: radical SAM protein, partial [Gemmatimonadaceae bacterium]
MPPRHVYIHVPFCARRCAYCDFSIAVRRTVPAARYREALALELSVRRSPSGEWPVETLYLGGGTPSRLGGPGLADVVLMLREWFHLEPGAEVTVEANPEDVTPGAVRAWRGAGVTRLSLGAQSFDEGALRWMHRTHSAEQT